LESSLKRDGGVFFPPTPAKVTVYADTWDHDRTRFPNVLECQCGVAPFGLQINLLWFCRFNPPTLQRLPIKMSTEANFKIAIKRHHVNHLCRFHPNPNLASGSGLSAEAQNAKDITASTLHHTNNSLYRHPVNYYFGLLIYYGSED